MHPRTFGAFLSVLTFSATNAADKCASNVLVKAFEGLNVNTFLVSCMTQNNFSAALDGSVDLTAKDAVSAPEQVKTICASDSCTTILSALVNSANFNLTNCIVGNDVVLMTEICNLQTTCTALSDPSKPKEKEGAPVDAPTVAPAPDAPPTTTVTEPVPPHSDSTPALPAPNNSPGAALATPSVVPITSADNSAPVPSAPVVPASDPVVPAPAPAVPAKEEAPVILPPASEKVDQESEEELKKQTVVGNPVVGTVGDHPPSTYCKH